MRLETAVLSLGKVYADDRQDETQSQNPGAGEERVTVRDKQLARILDEPYAKGDRRKAEEVLNLLDSSERRILLPPDPSRKGLGAINRDGVTCWLDALLFAMFSSLTDFDSMLVRHFADEPRERLAMMLRLYVNMMRDGRLITTDLVSLPIPWHDAIHLLMISRQSNCS